MEIDRIILGDNQFFGVNHMSQDKGIMTYKKFRDINKIRETLYCALDYGVHGVMLSTHPSVYEITNLVREDEILRENLNIYVNLPYIVKYMQMVNEIGLLRTVKRAMKGQSIFQTVRYSALTSLDVFTNNYLEIINRLIELEMNTFFNLKVKVIFLHNVLSDLIMSYNLKSVVKNFYNFIEKRYHAVPAFGTINLPMFDNFLKNAEIDTTLIMTAINKKGFLMNPSRESYETYLSQTKHKILAMATLASGALRPQEAYEYIFSLPNIRNIVVGFSTKEHMEETLTALRKFI